MYKVTLLIGQERHLVVGRESKSFRAGLKKPVSKEIAEACIAANTRARLDIFKVEETPDPIPEPEYFLPEIVQAEQSRFDLCL